MNFLDEEHPVFKYEEVDDTAIITFGSFALDKATGGGSCVVLPCTTASGAQFQISGTSQISVIRNGSFYNTDAGIDVDVPITSTDTMYDRQQLVEFIHGLK